MENEEDLKVLIEQNQYLKYVLKVMNNISLNEADEDIDFMELWNQVALDKKVALPETTSDGIALYYGLLTCGLDNMGLKFLDKFRENDSNFAILKCAICSLLDFITENYGESVEKSKE